MSRIVMITRSSPQLIRGQIIWSIRSELASFDVGKFRRFLGFASAPLRKKQSPFAHMISAGVIASSAARWSRFWKPIPGRWDLRLQSQAHPLHWYRNAFNDFAVCCAVFSSILISLPDGGVCAELAEGLWSDKRRLGFKPQLLAFAYMLSCLNFEDSAVFQI
jgi:hypothetical protein